MMQSRLMRAVTGAASVTILGLVGVTAAPVAQAKLARPSAAAAAAPVDKAKIAAAYGNLPLRFEANVGQTDPEARFVARSAGGTLFLTGTEAVLSISGPHQASQLAAGTLGGADPVGPQADQSGVVRMRPLGANPNVQPVGIGQLGGVSNYLTADPASTHRDVASYGEVRYPEMYPGIDQVFHGKRNALEYDFEVAPGADPATISLGLDGPSSVTVDAQTGELVLATTAGEVRQAKPVIYQDSAGGRRAVTGGYSVTGNQVGFHVGDYDHTKPLIIDPVIAYSALIGGTADEQVNGIAVDSTGAAYLAGTASSADYPTKNAFQATATGGIVITKLTPDGSALVYSTYLGQGNSATGIAVDPTGAAYVTGRTFSSSSFPLTGNSFRTTFSGVFDGIVAKLTPTGSALAYSTFLGGGAADTPAGISVDSQGNAYVAGTTTSTDFPTTDGTVPGTQAGYDRFCGTGVDATGQPDGLCNGNQRDVFLSKINTNATSGPASLAYSTYLGGAGRDTAAGVAVDPNESQGGVYIVGSSAGLGFPTTPTAFQPGCDRQLDPQAPCTFGSNAFVVKLSTNQSGPSSLTSGGAFGTYLGSRGNTNAQAVTADLFGVYVTGNTDAPGFPTKNALQTQLRQSPTGLSNQDAFVSKLVSDGTNLVYSTFLGGTNGDGGQGIAVDATGAAYVTGNTGSIDFPTKDAIQGPAAGFLTKLVPAGSALDYSTYLGVFGKVAVDPAGSSAVYVAGGVKAADFPAVAGSLGAGVGGGTDAAVVKLIPGTTPLVTQLTPRGGPTTGGTPVVIAGEKFTGATGVSFGGVAALSFTVDSPTQITAIAPPHAVGTIADLTVSVTVTGPQGTSLAVGPTRYVYGEGIFLPTGSCANGRCPTGGQAVTLLDGRVLYTNGTGNRFGNDRLPGSSQIYNPATGTWAATGTCTDCGYGEQGRTFSINTLPNGKVLVAGGLTGQFGDPTATAFLYDPTAGTWSATGSMTTARSSHTATLLPNGKVLVAGGSASGPPLSSSELYDPATGMWTRTPGDMTAARREHTATLLDTAGGPCGTLCGKVLIAFGTGTSTPTQLNPGLASAELFDPATGTWAATASSSGGVGRTRHSAVRLLDGRVLVTGGYENDAFGPQETNGTELYNPVTQTWSIQGVLNNSHGQQPQLIRLPNGKVLIVGGAPRNVQSDVAEIWNPADGRWRSATSSAYTPRIFPAAALLLSGPTSACATNCGKLLVAGGVIDTNSGSANPPVDTAELYTPRPDVTGITPSSGASGTSVTITGTGLASATTVRFGTATATPTPDPATPDLKLTVVPPANAAGPVDVVVSSPGGVSGPVTFTFLAAPTVTGISPASGPPGGATVVTITGTGFTAGSTVRFGSTAATAVTFNSATSLTATSPAGTGPVNVTVTTAGGSSSNAPGAVFTYATPAPPAPTVTGIAPTSGPPGGATVVTITGTNFTAGSTVTFGSAAATAVTFNSSTSLTATSPAGTGPVNVAVTTAGGTSPNAPGAVFTYTTPAPPSARFSRFVSLSPARILDTRSGNGAPTARVGAGGTVDVQVTGRGGVPSGGVTSVALNVTAATPSAGSFVTAWPTGETRPNASNLNLDAGAIVPNLVVVKVGAGGRVSLFNESGTIDLLADVAGYYLDPGSATPGSSFTAVSPARILDTRTGTGAPAARVGAGRTVDVQVAGQGGVPTSGVTAVAVNVTGVNPSGTSFVTAWPAGEGRPDASNLNLVAGVTRPNMVIVKVGAGGKVSLFNDTATVDLLADVTGYYLDPAAAPSSTFTALSPSRILDTRVGTGAPTVRVGPGQSIDVQVTGQGGVPSTGVTSVVMNVTSAAPSATSFITAWPTGEPQPNASSLNLTPRVTVANLVIVKVGAGGKVSLFNESGTTDLLADVAGYNTT